MNKELVSTTRDWTNLPAVSPSGVARPEYLAEPQSGSVLDYWRTLCRRKLPIMVCGAVGLALGIGVTLPQPDTYRSSTSLEIQEGKDDGAKILNPTPDSTPVDSLTDMQTQVKILQSRTLIEHALDKLHISTSSDLDPHPGAAALWLRALAPGSADEGRDTLVEKASKNLKITASGQTRIIEVSFDATDPALAARLANAVTAEFIEQNLEARWKMNQRTSEWLVGQLDELRGKLRSSEDALQTYARQKGLMYTGEKQNISEEKLRQLQAELSKAQADRVEKQSRSEIARNTSLETVPEVLNDSNLRLMEATLTDLRRQEADLGVTFKPDYTKAKRIRAEIEALEASVQTKRKTIINRIDNELQESTRREQLLGSAYARQTRLVTDDSEKSIQYDMLKHEVDTNRQIYQTMLQRVKESSIASALKATNVRVIDQAKAPSRPYKPNLPLNSAAGLFAGLMLGIASVVIRTKTNGSIQEPGDAGMLLGIPELGVIPAAAAVNFRRLPSMVTLFSHERTAESSNQHLVASLPRSPALTDSFRAVLASILFAGAKQRQRVLVVTSASPGEGKTTTAASLAVTLANMKRKVLLIDGDIRSPRLHDIFGLGNSTGLTTVLKQIAVSDTVESAICETAHPNLHVLTSGPGLHAGADLLFSMSMPSLIARVRDQFDMVLIDTPPMLTMPDARVLGRFADAVVLIARSGRTGRDAIQAAFRRFVEDHTPVLGIVLNDWNAKMSPYSYYSGYKDVPAEPAAATVTPAGA